MVLNLPLIDPDNVPVAEPVKSSPVVNMACVEEEAKYNGCATWTRVSPPDIAKNLFGAPVVVMDIVTVTGVAAGWAYVPVMGSSVGRIERISTVTSDIILRGLSGFLASPYGLSLSH